ncbi:MAG: DUF1302 family protein [Candidatus Kariarchaeaceae archaeon]
MIIIVLNSWIALAFGQGGSSETFRPEFRLLVEHETAFDFNLSKLQKSEWLIDPEISWRISDKIRFFSQMRLYAEFTDRLEPGKPELSNYSAISKPWPIGDKVQLELREFYFDIKIANSYWRIGKQQIVLGETEGFKVLDMLNPMSYREFILDDFDDSRIPLWSVKGEISLGAITMETFWIPDLTYHHFPFNGGLYNPALTLPEMPGDIELEQRPLNKPDHFIKDSDVGFRLSTLSRGWDLSLIYLYQYDNMPVTSNIYSKQIDVLSVEPTYRRQHVVGTTLNNTFGSFGLRGELGFIPNKYFTHFGNQSEGLLKTNQLISGIGLDYFGVSETLISVQWFSDWISENGSNEFVVPARRAMLNGVSMMLDRFFMNQTLEAKIFSAYEIENRSGMLDIKVFYNLGTNIKIWTGGDFFFGSDRGFIGQFNNRNRILIGIQWGIQSHK